VPSLSRYHCKCIFDEGAYLTIVLWFMYKGQVAEKGKNGFWHRDVWSVARML